MAPVAVLIKLRLADGREDEFETELSAIVERVRQEPACLSIHGHRDPADSSAFMLFELWRSVPEFEEFEQGRDYMTSYFERVKPWWVGPRDMTFWTQVT